MEEKIEFSKRINNKTIDKDSKMGTESTTGKSITKKSKKSKTSQKGSSKSKASSKASSKSTKNKPIPKKRGRRPKKIIDDIETMNEIHENESQRNEGSVIVKFALDPSKLGQLGKKKKIPQKIIDDSSDESSEDMFRDDIPKDNICQKCEKNEKTLSVLRSKLEKYENKEKINKTTKIYTNNSNLISLDTNKKINLKKVNLKCRWDSNIFNGIPCYLPERYYDGKYYVNSYCFCSFNCALAFNLYYLRDSKIGRRKSLVCQLYRELHGLDPNDEIDIKEAAPPEVLIDFGGVMTIETYRRSFNILVKSYITYFPPLKPLHMLIEERNNSSTNDMDDKKYILKREKPLNKKKSVISSMRGDDYESE